MELPVAHEPLKHFAAFSTGIDYLAREVQSLRKTGNPQHLPAIKDVTQRLMCQLFKFSAQLTGANVLLQEYEHMLALTRDCEYSGLQFLTYLHNLVAHARTVLSYASRQDVTVSFDWEYIRVLLKKLGVLRASMKAAEHLPGRKTLDDASIKPSASTNDCNGGQLYGFTPHVEACSCNESQSKGTAYELKSIATLQVEPHDSLETFPSNYKERLHQSPQSSNTSGDYLSERVLQSISSEHGLQSAQTLRLYRKWSELFRQQAIPALVLCYARYSSDVALSTSVIYLDTVSSKGLMQDLEQHIARYTSGLIHITMPRRGNMEHCQRLPDLELDQLTVESVGPAVSEVFGTSKIQDAIRGSADVQGFDALRQLASACLLVMKSTDPCRTNTVQRYLMYLTHILRHATFPMHEAQQYLDAIAETMSHHQAATPNRKLDWYLSPQPLNSLHLKPELRVYSDIRTFAAKEGLRTHPQTDPPLGEGRRRFAITTHALSSWSSRLQPDHPLKMFEPCLERRKDILTYLLTDLTPPESTLCGYYLWAEAVRLCNTGTVAEPAELLCIFLATSRRPDLLWNQIFGPSLWMGAPLGRVLEVLKEKVESAVAPDLLVFLIKRVEQRH